MNANMMMDIFTMIVLAVAITSKCPIHAQMNGVRLIRGDLIRSLGDGRQKKTNRMDGDHMAVYIFSKGKRDGSSGTSRQARELLKYADSNGLSNDDIKIYKEWEMLEKILQDGDTLICKDITSISKDLESEYIVYESILNKGVKLKFVNNPILNVDYIRLILKTATEHKLIEKNSLPNVIKILIATEYDRIEQESRNRSDRIKEGLKNTEKRPGRAMGKVDKLTEDLKRDIALYLADGSMLMADLMRKHGVSRNTLKKYIELTRKGRV